MTGPTLARTVIGGDPSSRRRLLGIVAGVMVGVMLFLLLTAASQAFGKRSRRSTWHRLATSSPTYLSPDTVLTPQTAAAVATSDHDGDRTVKVLIVATTPDTTVSIPGSDVVPRPGEYLASPAMAARIDAVPEDRLGARYGERVGVLSTDALEGPDSLVVVVGMDQSRVLDQDGLSRPQVVTEFVGYDYESPVYRIIALIGAIAVLVPVALLIAIVTDLGAAQRAERFATLRLIGARPGQVARIAAAETAVTTLVGALLGVAAYLAVVPLAARIEIGCSSFYPRDLLTSPAVAVGTVLGVALGASAVAWWRTRRADVGPLGASRERSERPPRLVSLLPLLLGLAGLTTTRVLREAEVEVSMNAFGLLLVCSFVATMLGLLWAGPLLTSWAARLVGRGARSAAQVIGTGRLGRHPRAAFRAVGGIVVAVYVVTLFSVAITAAAGTTTLKRGSGYLDPTTLYAAPGVTDPAALDAAADRLDDVAGVRGVAVGWMQDPVVNEDGSRTDVTLVLRTEDASAIGVPDARSDTGWVSVSPEWLLNSAAAPEPAPEPDMTAEVGPRGMGGMGPGDPGSARVVLFVAVDADPASSQRARTAMTTSDLELTGYPVTREDNVVGQASAMENQFAALGYIGILIAAGVSTVSLTVSMIAALLARRRVLSLLRLVGMPRSTLRRVVACETLLPVVTVMALSIGTAAFTAWVVISSSTDSRTVDWPGASYYVVVGVCLALVGLSVVASTRAASRMVAGSTVRFE